MKDLENTLSPLHTSLFIPSLIKEFREAKTYHYALTDAPIITAFDSGDKIKLTDKLFYFCSATSVFQ